MSLLAVERIKLFSTRSPWWCIGMAIVISVGIGALATAFSGSEEFPATVGTTQVGYNIALVVVMVLAVLAATTEYRFGTIRATFLAVPSRTKVVLAKTALVTFVCGLLGEFTAFTAWGVGNLIKPNADLAINTAGEWRYVAGVGVIYALSAVLSVAIGLLIRQTAGAITIVLVYSIVLESILSILPRIGDDIAPWLLFFNANHFLTAGAGEAAGEGAGIGLDMHWGPWGALAYFAAISFAFLALAVVVVNKRDA